MGDSLAPRGWDRSGEGSIPRGLETISRNASSPWTGVEPGSMGMPRDNLLLQEQAENTLKKKPAVTEGACGRAKQKVHGGRAKPTFHAWRQEKGRKQYSRAVKPDGGR
ncbi:unnamed protein product [Gulo gulo]|uniref:Uncharacterized protein n=1 Tax=Gulo gulo TaxID=48420 RepID=A0A9X9LY24_GULGU|nr:unnamed protein product [Gulo gulo]